DEHRVAPLSLAAAGLAYETPSGRFAVSLSGEAGGEWSSRSGWGFAGRARAGVECVILAVNDLPISLFATSAIEGDDRSFPAQAGLRFALPFTRGGPR